MEVVRLPFFLPFPFLGMFFHPYESKRLHQEPDVHLSSSADAASFLLGDKDRCLVEYDGFVLRYQYLHDTPADEIGDGADAEDDEVTGRLAFESHELHGRLDVFSALGQQGFRHFHFLSVYHGRTGSIGKQHTRTFVDEVGTDTACHTSQADDGSHGTVGEHVAAH